MAPVGARTIVLEKLTLQHPGDVTADVARAVIDANVAKVVDAGADADALATRFLGRVQVKGKTEPVEIIEIFEGDPADDYSGEWTDDSTFRVTVVDATGHDPLDPPRVGGLNVTARPSADMAA